MDTIPRRLPRLRAEPAPSRRALTQRERNVQAYILEAAGNIFVVHGRGPIVMTKFACALGLAPATIRRHFYDLDHIFAHILSGYLDTILAGLGEMPGVARHIQAARRMIYFRLTRGVSGIATPMHALLLRDRFLLPRDELEPLEAQRQAIGRVLGGDAWEETLYLLDAPSLDLAKIEALLDASAAIDRARRGGLPDPAATQSLPPTQNRGRSLPPDSPGWEPNVRSEIPKTRH
jgi:AcrR family transcriptional regulator